MKSLRIRFEVPYAEECKLLPSDDYLTSEKFSMNVVALQLSQWITAQQPTELANFSKVVAL